MVIRLVVVVIVGRVLSRPYEVFDIDLYSMMPILDTRCNIFESPKGMFGLWRGSLWSRKCPEHELIV